MAHGGARPGAGHPLGTVNKVTLTKQYLSDMLRDLLLPHAEEIAMALVNKAKTGDAQAIKEYNERTYGKVRDDVHHTGDVQFQGVLYLPQAHKSDE